MKKRLSLLMAALMIITMLPMSAFAAAKPYVTVQTIDNTELDGKSVVTFEVDKFQGLNEGKVVFELVNAKLKANSTGFKAPKIAVTDSTGTAPKVVTTDNGGYDGDIVADDKTFVVEFSALSVANTKERIQVTLTIPEISYKDSQDGDVKLMVTDLGKNNTIVGLSSQEFKIATVNPVAKSLTLTAKTSDDEISYDGGDVARVEVKNFNVNDDQTHLALELDQEDYYAFDKSTKVLIDGKVFTLNDTTMDKDGYVILIPKDQIQDAKLIIVNPVIAKMGRGASEGTVNLTAKAIKQDAASPLTPANYFNYTKKVDGKDVKAYFTVLQSDTATIAKVVDYKVTMKVVEKNKKEIPSVWGGEEATVTVTLTAPKGSFSNRAIEFEAKDADIIRGSVRVTKSEPATGSYDVVGGLREDADNDAVYRDGKFIIKGVDEKTTKVVFDMRVRVDHSLNGTATLTAAQRGWDTTADLIKSTPKFTVAADVTDMKKGEQKDTANIVITEAKEGLLRSGEKITLLFNTTKDYVEFAKVAKVEATNGMTFGDWAVKRIGSDITSGRSSYSLVDPFARYRNGGIVPSNAGARVAVEIPVRKQSKGGAAVITISGIQTRVDGSTVDSDVTVYAGLNLYTVASTKYIKVVKEYGLEPILTVFTIGQTQYTVNGKPMTAASAPYVKNGRTMLPVRALAESLGLHVQWNGATKTATFTDSTKVAAVVIGADTMYINGTPVKLSAKAEIVNGTTFIELRSLATVFGVQIDWDAAAKTATVSK